MSQYHLEIIQIDAAESELQVFEAHRTKNLHEPCAEGLLVATDFVWEHDNAQVSFYFGGPGRVDGCGVVSAYSTRPVNSNDWGDFRRNTPGIKQEGLLFHPEPVIYDHIESRPSAGFLVARLLESTSFSVRKPVGNGYIPVRMSVKLEYARS